MEKRLRTLLLSSLICTSVFAKADIYGDYIDESEHPESVCKLESAKYLLSITQDGPQVKVAYDTFCSATMITKQDLITANHCFNDEYIAFKEVYVNCPGQDRVALDTKNIKAPDSAYDIAIAQTEEEIDIEPMKIADKKIHKAIVKKPIEEKVAVFGYGVNNEGKSGTLHGAYVDSLKSSREGLDAAVELMKQPKLIQEIFLKKLVEIHIIVPMKEFKKIESQLMLIDQSDLLADLMMARTEHEKEAVELFYKGIFAAQAEVKKKIAAAKAEFQEKKKSVTEFYTIKGPKNEEDTESIILPGDSGGPMLYKNKDSEWVLLGVNSSISTKAVDIEIKTEDVVSTQTVLMGDRGHIAPLTSNLFKFVKKSIKDYGDQIITSKKL